MRIDPSALTIQEWQMIENSVNAFLGSLAGQLHAQLMGDTLGPHLEDDSPIKPESIPQDNLSKGVRVSLGMFHGKRLGIGPIMDEYRPKAK